MYVTIPHLTIDDSAPTRRSRTLYDLAGVLGSSNRLALPRRDMSSEDKANLDPAGNQADTRDYVDFFRPSQEAARSVTLLYERCDDD